KVAPKERIDFRQFIVQVHNLGKNGGRLIVKNRQLRNVALETGKEAEEQNKEIWAAFKEAVEAEFEQSRIRRICEQHNIDWEKIAQRTQRFDPAHVECFGAGAALVKDCELEEIAKKPLSAMTLSELRAVYEKGTASAYLGEQKNPKDLHGAPYTMHEQAKRNPLLESQTLGTLFKGIENLVSEDPNLPRLALYFSRLAMAIICLFTATEQDVGKVIPAPGPNKGELDFFKVHSVVSKGGLTAYFLVPIAKDSTLTPTVLFRCTNQAISQNNAMHSVKNCFAENIGENGWLACKEEIAKVMQDPTFTQGKKITTLSYSLGGSHQGYFVREYLDQIDKVYAFNAVGNDKAVALAIAEKINKAPPNYVPPSFYHIRNIHNEQLGDFVNILGDMRVGCKLNHPNAQVVLIERVLDDRPPPDPKDPLHLIALKYYHPDRLERRCRRNIYHGDASYKKLNPGKYEPEMEKRRKDFRSYFDAFWVCYELVEFIFALFNIKLFQRRPSKHQ
ncbi:MAG TPA: hypothetical protein VJ112_00605, partial [Rhabdochlamydiaceae bacterium]|nr:hypothetical protein [Rhabdochlamydiaceae bacterium]